MYLETDTIKTSLKEKRVINATHLVLSFFVLSNALAGVWNETSSGNRTWKSTSRWSDILSSVLKC